MNWVVTQHQFIWNNEQQFLNYLRRKLPIISGGSGIILTTTGSSGAATFDGTTLNIPIYTGGGGGNLDATLALGGSLTANRTIDGAGHGLIVNNTQLRFTNMVDPALVFNPFPTALHGFQYLVRATTASATNVMPFEMAIDNNANGGPPDDNIYLEGWNIDSRTVPAEASWTTRMEAKFQGGNYEYHLQFSQGIRLYRLMSFTFRNFGDTPHDENLLFFTVSGMEARNMAGNGFWSVGNNTTTSPDVTVMSMTNRASTKQIIFTLDDPNSSFTITASAGSLPFQVSGFTIADFGATPIKTTGGLINSFFAPPASGSTYTFESGSSDMTIFWIPSHVSNTAFTIVSGNTGEFGDHFNSGGGWFRGFFAGATLTLKLDNLGATVTALPFNVTGSTNINITSDGATSLINGSTNSAFRMIASVPAQLVGPYIRNTSSTGTTNFMFENNRGSFANYMFMRLEGATSTLDNTVLGIATTADWMLFGTGGANNLGFVMGTITAVPLVFSTNNVERARFTGAGGLNFKGSTTANPQINYAVGTAPTSPVDGDWWLESNTNTGLKIRINGVTKTVSLV